MKLRIAVVGLGRYVEIAHMPTYFNSRYSKIIDVAALCDINEQRLNEWMQRYNIEKGYTSVDEMLKKEDLDAVVVVTPDHLHTEIVCKALESGKDVLVEKPLATDIADCDKMIRLARKNKLLLITDFHKRYDPAHQEARYRIIEQKKYGEVQFGYVWMQDTINIPAGGFFKSNLAENSSPVWFLGVHFFDLIRFITNLEPLEIRATGYRQVLPKRGVNTLDAVKSDIIFNNGASISFYLSWNLPESAPNPTRQGLYLQFEQGELTIDTTFRGMYELSNEGYRSVNPLYTHHSLEGYAGYAHESIGEALTLFYELKKEKRKNYEKLAEKIKADYDGFYATLMAEVTHKSIESDPKKDSKEVYIGRIINTNEYIKEKLGQNANQYLIKNTLT